MTPTVVILSVMLVLAVVGGGFQVWLADRNGERNLSIAREGFGNERKVYVEIIAQEQAARKQASDKFAEILNSMSEDHAEQLRGVMNMKSFGVPEVAPATVTPAKDDAESRLGRMVREQTIEAGAKSIKKRYEDMGLTITIEDARVQAKDMLSGSMPSV